MQAVLVLLVALLSLVTAQLITYYPTHHAILDNIQAGTPSTATGASYISFNKDTGYLVYTLLNSVSGVTAAHIHGPAAVGSSAGVLVTLDASSISRSGQLYLMNATGYTPDWINYLNNGLAYINIHSNAYPGGEIRGQILASGQQITTLDGTQDSVNTAATGVAFTSFNAATMTISGVLSHTVSDVTSAHIHGPAAPGASAGVLVPLNHTTNPISFSAVLTAAQVDYLNTGVLYYNVHSTAYPGGEVRGQIWPIANYVAALNGVEDNQNTLSTGVGLVGNYGSNVYAAIYHNVYQPSAAHIHQGVFGSSGDVVYPFQNASANPIMQSFTVVSTAPTFISSPSQLYFNIHTSLAPGGLIRAQILPKSGSADGPTATTTGTTSQTTTTSTTSSAPILYASCTALILGAVLLA